MNKEKNFLDMVTDILAEDYTAHQKINIFLKDLNNVFKTDIGILSKIQSDTYTIMAASSTYVPGDIFELKETYCSLISESHKMHCIVDIGDSECSLKKHPLYEKQKIETYIAFPIFIDDDFYGTINFSSKNTREPFSKEEIELLESVTKIVEKLTKKL
jgi:transcriptional regulator with GAF, ATPase, and Fis domain